MKRIPLAILSLAALCGVRPTLAQTCPAGSTWTQSWTDPEGETTYSLQAPCVAYIGVPFQVVATVTDATYPDTAVAADWTIVDDNAVIAGGDHPNWIATSGGQWQQIVTETYTGTPVDHTIDFQFTDLGDGAGAHFWQSDLLGSITVDPYPDSPPSVQAGPALTVASAELSGAVVPGAASDPDGDPLSFRWLEGDAVLQAWRPVGPSGDASLALAQIAPLPVGTYVLTLEVTDGAHVVDAAVTLTVENSPPVVAPAGGGTHRVGRRVLLGGTVSDFDGDGLEFEWLLGAEVLARGSVAAAAGGAPATLPDLSVGPLRPGSYSFTLSVTDGAHVVQADVAVFVARP